MILPDWVKEEEPYHPGKDRDAFISRSLLRLLSILQVMRSQGQKATTTIGAAPALLMVFFMVLLVVSARTSAFLWAVLAGELVLLCFRPGPQLRSILSAAMGAMTFSALLVGPSFFLGNGKYMLLLPCKTFLTVTALMLLQGSFSWHSLTGALQRFHVPGILIFILDTTLRYIVVLGEVAAETLTALQLRSVGYNRHKKESFSGVAGVVLQKSHRLSQDLYEAMCCRCFTGDFRSYEGHGKLPPSWKNGLFLLPFLFYGYLFICLEIGGK